MQVHSTLLDSQTDSAAEGMTAAPVSKEIYLVHYNGFVFGANFSKIIIIREREANKDNDSPSSSSSDSDSAGEDDNKAEVEAKPKSS